MNFEVAKVASQVTEQAIPRDPAMRLLFLDAHANAPPKLAPVGGGKLSTEVVDNQGFGNPDSAISRLGVGHAQKEGTD